MNRKTATILCTAGGLAAAAAILATRPRPATGSHGPIVIEAPAPVDACRTGAPASRQSSDFGLGTMTAALSGERVLQNGDGEMYLSIDLAARDTAETRRPPLNLAIVIDHSGSMAGDKMVQARAAARGLVERLGAQDRAALIQFDDTAQVLVPAVTTDDAGKARLQAAIATIQDAGGTNIYDGMVLGRNEVQRALSEGRINRVILLSDGNANVGTYTDIANLSRVAAQAADVGVRITSVGLGLDYNEDLLEAIAENGRGQYYYVKDAEGLGPVFAGELRSIQATVATAAALRLEPSCAGVEIEEVYGYETRREGAAVIVPLADLAGGDKRKVVARVKVPVALQGREGVASASLTFTDIGGGVRKGAVASLGVEVSPDVARVEEAVDRGVLGQVEQVEAARTMRQAAQAYAKGDQAGAMSMLRAHKAEAMGRAKKYKMTEAEMKPAMEPMADMAAEVQATPPSAPAAPAVTKGAKASSYSMSH